nr:cytochrome P450 [Pharsalia antennata]
MTYFGSFVLDLLAVLTALLAVGYAYLSWTFQYWKKRNVPYLEPVIPWGNFMSPFTKTKSVGQEMVDLYNRAKAKGWKYFGIYIVTQTNFVAMDLDTVKHVMTKDFHNFVDRGVYTNEKDDPLSCHLFSIGGVKWRNLRTKLSPTFTSGKLKNMFSTLVDCGLVLEKYIESNIDNVEGADIKEILGKFSTDIIGSCAFGLECNSFTEPNSPFREYGKKIFQPLPKLRSFIRILMLQNHKLARALGVRQTNKEVSDFFTKVVKDTVAYREKNNYARNDFLQLLINSKENGDGKEKNDNLLTMNEIVAQSYVFFIAGFETSSSAMTFALFELAMHPEIQDKVREEIKTVLAKHDDKITYDSLSELKYMGQVIEETLRKYAPLNFITRECVEDYKVPGEDVVIEKGTRILIPVRGIHYDEEYYPDPQKFDPDRFTEEEKRKRNQYTYLPFGEGPRICIGLRFGVMQSKVGLTSILRKFKVTLNEKTEVPLKMNPRAFVTTSEGGIWLNLEKL